MSTTAEPRAGRAAGEGASSEHEPDDPGHKKALDEDWDAVLSNLRERSAVRRGAGEPTGEARGADAGSDDDDGLYDDEPPKAWYERRWLIWLISAAVVLAGVGATQLWFWLHPRALSCSVDVIRPQKFKIDVTDFFAPRVSAALQLVLHVRNTNLLRSMLLEGCKLVAIDAGTGLKLGSAQQGPLVVGPRSVTQLSVSLPQIGSSLSGEDQRALAASFLAKKVLFVTVLATASSRLPTKTKRGEEASTMSVATNSSRRIDLAALTKEPFFQRAPAAPKEADAAPVHDVPL